MSKLKKAVCLSGGFGSRLNPATLVTNKHVLPVYVDNNNGGAIPMLHFPLKTLKNSGIEEVLIITSQEHGGTIIDYFSDGKKIGLDLTYKIQDMYPEDGITGIAQAMKLSKSFCSNENFAVILGDNYYEDTFEKEFSEFSELKPLPGNTFAPATIFLKEVSDPQRFGCATLDTNGKVIEIIEKPKEPKSNWAVTGLYLYTPHVFELLPTLVPSARKELEVSNINDYYVKNNCMRSVFLKNKWSDLGTPKSMLHICNYLSEKNNNA